MQINSFKPCTYHTHWLGIILEKKEAENILVNVKDFVSKDEYLGGSYDGAYFHQSVPKFLEEKFEVDENDVQDDHDWLHKCGICEKNIRKLDKITGLTKQLH